jgi:hypothetical protein
VAVVVEPSGDGVEIWVSDPGGSLGATGWTLDGDLDGRAAPELGSGTGQGLSEARGLVAVLGWRLVYRASESSFVVAVPSSTATTVTSSSASSPAV